MSYTYDGVRAEVEYRRGQMLAGADESRLVRRLRRSGRVGRHRSTGPSSVRWEQVRDGTGPRNYDLAA
jgi:hypothetical protein